MNVTLFRWLFRPLISWTFSLAAAAVFWTLFSHKPLWEFRNLPVWFIIAHAGLIATLLGRTRTLPFAYLYSRGFNRDTLWIHIMFAAIASGLMVWLPASLIVWTGARAALGDAMLSPYQPLIWPRETWVPVWWLAVYLIVLPLFQYAWISQAREQTNRGAGWILVAGEVVLLFAVIQGRGMLTRYLSTAILVLVAFAVTALACLVAGFLLNRALEANP